MKTIIEIFSSLLLKPMSTLKGVDLHSMVAKEYFCLSCDVEEVSYLYPKERNQVKQALYHEIYK